MNNNTLERKVHTPSLVRLKKVKDRSAGDLWLSFEWLHLDLIDRFKSYFFLGVRLVVWYYLGCFNRT